MKNRLVINDTDASGTARLVIDATEAPSHMVMVAISSGDWHGAVLIGPNDVLKLMACLGAYRKGLRRGRPLSATLQLG